VIASWVDARRDQTTGAARLIKMSTALETRESAVRFLKLLHLEHQIPTEARDPQFIAKAKLFEKLAQPEHYGQAPASIELINHRELMWPTHPPEVEKKEAWLFRFIEPAQHAKAPATPQTHYGLVCEELFLDLTPRESSPTPEDLYVHFCRQALSADVDKKGEPISVSIAVARAFLEAVNPGFGRK
jgi:hypothetical protein